MSDQSLPISGSDYLTFLADPTYWPKDDQTEVYAENVVLAVDGQRYEQGAITVGTVKSTSTVMIVAGDVFEFMTPLHSLQAHYDSWCAARQPNEDGVSLSQVFNDPRGRAMVDAIEDTLASMAGRSVVEPQLRDALRTQVDELARATGYRYPTPVK